MKHARIHALSLAFALIIGAQACAVEAADLGKPGTPEEFSSLYHQLEQYDDIGIAGPREDVYLPENVLPRIHTWLTEYRGLRRDWVSGYDILVVSRKIPDQVLAELTALAYPDTHKSGLEILQASFWKRARELQDRGIRIGFIVPKADQKVSGVYFSEYKPYYWANPVPLIAFDVFANQGTLTHELRHHEQHLAIEKRYADRAQPWNPWFEDKPETLSESCVAQVGRFLGELDSTTVELPSWIGVFKSLEIAPEWHRSAVSGDQDPARFPQKWLLQGNLDYPGLASAWIKGANCPPELLEAAEKIKVVTEDFAARTSTDYTIPLFHLRMSDLHGWSYVNSYCQASSPQNPLVTPASCQKRQDDLGLIPQKAAALAQGLDEMLAKEAAERAPRVKEVLNALPYAIKRDLCRHAQAFEFLADCQGMFQ